jgi:hypothetical protein
MRALRIALLVLSVAVLGAPTAFAKGAAGAAGGGAGAGGTGGAGSGAGAGSNPSVTTAAAVNQGRGHYKPVRVSRPRASGACYRQAQLYDRYGYAVVNLHGADCLE